MTKLMLVEDDNNLREIYGARLQAEGYEIVSAKDGEEALALAVKERPDLIVSDVMMPKISGFDMLDILRSTTETKNTKVIMMTALSQKEDQERGEKLGADRYLVKSQVTLEDVVKVVGEVLAEGSGDIPPVPADTIPEPAAPVVAPATNPVADSQPPAPVASPAPATVDPVAATPTVPTAEPSEPDPNAPTPQPIVEPEDVGIAPPPPTNTQANDQTNDATPLNQDSDDSTTPQTNDVQPAQDPEATAPALVTPQHKVKKPIANPNPKPNINELPSKKKKQTSPEAPAQTKFAVDPATLSPAESTSQEQAEINNVIDEVAGPPVAPQPTATADPAPTTPAVPQTPNQTPPAATPANDGVRPNDISL